MDLLAFKSAMLEFVRLNDGWAPFLVGAVAFGESVAFLSLLTPATAILVGVGVLIGSAGLEFWPIWLGAALGAPFRVYGPDGDVFDGGTVGGGPIELDPGTYRVEVLSDPPVEFDEVVVGGGEAVILELPAEG